MNKRSLLRALGGVAGWAATCSVPALAQSPAARESAVKAAFLFKFASFVEWPAGTFQRADQPIVIGVAGHEDVASDLEQLVTGRTVEGRPVVVKRIAEGVAPGATHIVFVGERRDARLHDLIDEIPGPVLVVTEQPGGRRAGAVLNFLSDGARVRFTVSLAAAEARNLKLSARLLSVAQAVEGRK